MRRRVNVFATEVPHQLLVVFRHHSGQQEEVVLEDVQELRARVVQAKIDPSTSESQAAFDEAFALAEPQLPPE